MRTLLIRLSTVALAAVAILFMPTTQSTAQDEPDLRHGRTMMLSAFDHDISQFSRNWLDGVETLEDWKARRVELRREFAEMFGLWPEPEKTDLQVTVTGTADHEDFTVHNLHYQSLPGLYVTANLYVPKELDVPAPAVLYMCGHASRVIDGVSYGSKVAYQRHPAWYARHGMVALIIDPLNNGEIRGLHHGTHNQGRWWWYNRGYTPAAIEAWNAVRALDLLEGREEVDAGRIGATGRSGGGMYSWLLLALDDRLAVATPTAGITDLHDHLVEEAIRGHCDCNYWNNFHRLDTTIMAALAAPRPVRLVNTDSDHLFPTGGINRIDEQVKKIYSLYDEEDRWDVFVGSGGHSDTRELQVATFKWMHRWLKGEELEEVARAEGFFDAEELQVFDELPADERNTRIDEEFAPALIAPPVPDNRRRWERMKENWMAELKAKPFAGWPQPSDRAPRLERVQQTSLSGLALEAFDYSPQEEINLRLWTLQREGSQPDRTVVRVMDAEGWQSWVAALRAAAPESVEEIIGPGAHAVAWPEADAEAFAEMRGALGDGEAALVMVAPRGIGPTHFEEETGRGDTIRRSFPMLGQTIDGMRVWDVRQAVAAIRASRDLAGRAPQLEAENKMAAIVLYASLFDEPVHRLDLRSLQPDHQDGPYLLNIDQILNTPQLLAMARERTRVNLHESDSQHWEWADRLDEALQGEE